MLRTLRAFAWLRWRMLINSLERTGSRDTLERFSIAIEQLGPIMAGVLMIPSGLALGGIGVSAGFALARNHQSLQFEFCRLLLGLVPILCIVGPLLLPAADRTNPVRLLLLPISRSTLYIAQSASAFGDVWVLLMLPLLLALSVGLAAGGAVAAAAVALPTGALLVFAIVGLSSLATTLLHLAMRDRRRGELLALLFILLLPILTTLPGLLQGERHQRQRNAAQGQAREQVRLPSWAASAASGALALLPTELYMASTRAIVNGDTRRAARGVAALAASGLVLHALGMYAFRRMLDSPGSTGARRAVPMRGAWARRLPGLTTGASAVALTQLRLGFRTSRGRSILLSPIMMLFIVGVVMRRNMDEMQIGPIALQSGLSLASFASYVSLIAILPVAMNQFAVDKAGITRALLSPLSDGEYLAGKAVGNALIAACPTIFCLVACRIAFPGGSLALWLALPLALASIYLLVAPAAAILSAVFPRTVDMNSIGRAGNAHGLSALLGIFTFVGAGVPPLVIITIVSSWMKRPALAPLVLLLWCAACYGISRLLFVPARRIFASRRENLAMLL